MDLPKRSENNIRVEHIKDEEISNIIKALEDDPKSENYIQWSKRGYLMHNGILYRFTEDHEDENAKLVVPKHEIQNLLNTLNADRKK